MIIDQHHPDFFQIDVYDENGNKMTDIKSIDLYVKEYSRYAKKDGVYGDGIEIVRVKSATYDWYRKRVDIVHMDP